MTLKATEKFECIVLEREGLIVSEATLHPFDLWHVFRDIVRLACTPESWEYVQEQLTTIPDDADENRDHSVWYSEEISWDINETLFNALCEIAPDRYYFGVSEGDGACFGFWKAEEDCPEDGDPTDDCADCAYSGDFHLVNDECVKRESENTTINMIYKMVNVLREGAYR